MVNSRRLLFLAVVIASLQLLWLLKYVPTYQYRWKSSEDSINEIEVNSDLHSDSLNIIYRPSINISVDTKYNDTFGLCHTFGELISKSKSTSTLIIGASSFIGGSIARLLHESQVPVIATEDNVNIGFDPMAWYHWEQLIGMGMSPQYVNYSNHDMTMSLLKSHTPRTVIYVPTPLMEGEFNKSVREITELQENFVSLLKMLTKVSPSTNIILVSIRDPKSSYSSLIKLFDLSLSVYNRLYGTSIAIIRTEGVYGPWQNPKSKLSLQPCYIKDLVNTLKKLLGNNEPRPVCLVQDYKCEGDGSATPLETGQALTKQWLTEYNTYLSKQTKDIIASPFFTTKRNAQYPIEFMTNNYYFLENWFKNIYKMNLSMVVHHDDLSDKFVSTFMANYPKADFDKIRDFKDFRPNDRRYLAYYDYILAHPEIRRIVMTDMRDVIIQNNPFEMMDVLGDRPYVGLDRPFFHISRDTGVHGVYKRCFNDKSPIKIDYSKELDMLGYFNSGVTGGTRHVTLAILTKFLQLFKVSTKDNCNMAIVGYIYHKYYFDQLHMGWPFNTAFITNQPNIPGLSVLHKWDLLSYN